jgi:L-ascorbate metabolism protein UlaG (beta-lactamase superfamily)
MGPDYALGAVKLLERNYVLSIHYNTFDVITQDADAWADRVRRERSAQPVILKPGEWFDIPRPVRPK